MVPVEAFASVDVQSVKDGNREAGQTTHMHLVEVKSGGCADVVAVRCVLDM